MAVDSKEAQTQSGKSLVITRTFHAPRELVFKAWTDPEMAMQWWGPKTFTTPYCKIDLRVGGKYLNCMRSPEGVDYWSTGVFREIDPPAKLVMTDSFADKDGNVVPASFYSMEANYPLEMLVTVTFEEQDGKTLMTLTHSGMPDADSGASEGWNQSFDKLAELLSRIVASNHKA